MTPLDTPPVLQGGKVVTTPAGEVTVTLPAASSAPTTRTQIRELRARRDELSSQIGNITSRRNDISGQLRAAAPGADRAGLEARLGALDKRIVDLEGQLNVTGTALASAKGDAAAYAEQPPPGPPGEPSGAQITAISIVFFLAVLMPLMIALGRRVSGKGGKQVAAAASPEIVQRLDRMEEGIEAIAIEIERISEGQRFVTKVLGSGPAEPIAEPIAVPRGEAVAAERRS